MKGRVFPVEWAVALMAVLCIALYSYLGIPLRAPFYLYLRKVAFAVSTYALGLLLLPLILRLVDIRRAMTEGICISWKQTFDRYRQSYLSASHIICSLRCLHAVGLMFVVYINLKHLIPFVNSNVHDGLLASLEKQWFGGQSPTELLIQFLGSNSAAVLSQGYTFFYPYVAILSVAIVLNRSPLVVQRQVLGFVLLWFAAILFEYLYPTWGPCFSTPELVAQLPFTRVSELQNDLWQQRNFVIANPGSEKGVFLISGLPSLHFAMVVMGTLYFRQRSRFLFWGSLFFSVVTAVTTIYFGWHFVSDLLAALLLVLLVEIFTRLVISKCCLEN